MQKSIVEHLSRLNEEGEVADSPRAMEIWATKVTSFLKTALGATEAAEFTRLLGGDAWMQQALCLGHLQGLIARAQAESPNAGAAPQNASPSSTPPSPLAPPESTRVFVVHGHDSEAKESTARFLEKLGLQPIILHEQASGGRTVIEKFEKFSGDVAFAVILLTPDDVGSVISNQSELRPRARQNVVLELGYFMGRLSRDRVCALYKGGVELPSDYQGVIYIEMDTAGAWKAKLAQEFVQAKLPINLGGLLGG